MSNERELGRMQQPSHNQAGIDSFKYVDISALGMIWRSMLLRISMSADPYRVDELKPRVSKATFRAVGCEGASYYHRLAGALSYLTGRSPLAELRTRELIAFVARARRVFVFDGLGDDLWCAYEGRTLSLTNPPGQGVLEDLLRTYKHESLDELAEQSHTTRRTSPRLARQCRHDTLAKSFNDARVFLCEYLEGSESTVPVRQLLKAYQESDRAKSRYSALHMAKLVVNRLAKEGRIRYVTIDRVEFVPESAS